MEKQNTILLVDDDPTFNFITEIMLKQLKITRTITSAKNGQEALDLLVQYQANQQTDQFPEVIFLDLNMPVMDGFEFLEEYKKFPEELTKAIRIYVLTSSVNPKDEEKVLRYPITGFISKPIDKEVLQKVLSKETGN